MACEVLIGEFETAQSYLREYGGQLYCGPDNDGPFVVSSGRRQWLFWPEKSQRRIRTWELAEQLNYPERTQATGGKLVKFFVNDLVGLPYQKTFWHKSYRELAVDGSHWHYTYCKPGFHGLCVELDIKSAYWCSFTKRPSALLTGGGRWMDDGGAVERMSKAMAGLPKAFRLQLLGMLASWRKQFFVIDKESPDRMLLKSCYNYSIDYGAAFNAAHYSIQRVYALLAALHDIAGDWVVRCHTDSICYKVGIPEEIEMKIEHLLTKNGYQFECKAVGDTFLYDLNTGVIGKKFIGGKPDAVGRLKETGKKLKDYGEIFPFCQSTNEKIQRFYQRLNEPMST